MSFMNEEEKKANLDKSEQNINFKQHPLFDEHSSLDNKQT